MPGINGYAVCQGIRHMQCDSEQLACSVSGDAIHVVYQGITVMHYIRDMNYSQVNCFLLFLFKCILCTSNKK